MKTRMIFIIAVVLGISFQASAQETDDMYFRSKDRETIKKTASTDNYSSNYENFKKKHFPEAEEQDAAMNPTDSYSANQINPEFIARSNSDQAAEDEQNYFIDGYQSPASTPTDSYSSSYNQWNNQSMYYPGWYGPSYYNSGYSPYYGYNDPWMSPYNGGYYNPWMSPYYGYNSGWNSSFGYYGSPWSSGWNIGIGYTWGNSWCSNYYGSPYYGSPYNYGYYPAYTYTGESSRPNYGKRPSRNSALVGDVRKHYSSNSTSGSTVNGGTTSGRTRDEYYVRPGRRISTFTNSSGTNSANSFGTSGTSRTRTYSTNDSNSFNSNSSPNRSTNSYQQSRSSTFSSPSIKSSGSSSHSRPAPSSGSRSRGGN